MVGGFRRLARVLGVSRGFCGAAVAMVLVRALRLSFSANGSCSVESTRFPAAAAGVADAEAAAALSWPGGSLTRALPSCAHRNSGRLRARGLAWALQSAEKTY